MGVSTKIHNGYRWRPETAPDPFYLAAVFRLVVEPVRNEAYLRRLIADAVAIIDSPNGGGPSKAPLFEAARNGKREADAAAAKGLRSIYDFGCQIVMLRDDGDPDALYLLTYTEVDIDAAMLSIPGMTEYRYWNNTDPPDDVTPTEWQTRAATWDRVVGWSPPVTRGIIWQAEQANVAAALADATEFIPSREDRARAALRLIRANEAIAADTPTTITDVARVISEAEEGAVDDPRFSIVLNSLAEITTATLLGQ